MNTHSHYKKKVSKHKKAKSHKKQNTTTMVVSEQKKDKQMHIKLETPIVDPQSDCYKYKYDILRTLNTDLSEINENMTRISLCIYRVVHCKNQQNVKHPFLQYLLYKYPDNLHSTSNLMVFPFIDVKKNILHKAKKFAKQLVGKNVDFDGFIEKKNTVYLFLNYESVNDEYINKVFYMTKENTLWWCLIDEICNHRTVLTFPVHKSVFNLFYNNPSLIYLKQGDLRIEIPIVAYYGNYFNFLPIIAALGQRESTAGSKKDFIYFSGFKKSVRFGSWTPDYRTKFIYDEQVSDIDGLYKKCGIIRFALFLGKFKLLNGIEFDQLQESIESKNWTSEFNSLLITDIDFDNKKLSIDPEYILKRFEQQTPLSYHEIDKKTLTPTWDYNYPDYNII